MAMLKQKDRHPPQEYVGVAISHSASNKLYVTFVAKKYNTTTYEVTCARISSAYIVRKVIYASLIPDLSFQSRLGAEHGHELEICLAHRIQFCGGDKN